MQWLDIIINLTWNYNKEKTKAIEQHISYTKDILTPHPYLKYLQKVMVIMPGKWRKWFWITRNDVLDQNDS